MHRFLLAAVALGGLTAGAVAAPRPMPHEAFTAHRTQARLPMTQVDYYRNHHRWHHRHWEHNRWRYYN